MEGCASPAWLDLSGGQHGAIAAQQEHSKHIRCNQSSDMSARGVQTLSRILHSQAAATGIYETETRQANCELILFSGGNHFTNPNVMKINEIAGHILTCCEASQAHCRPQLRRALQAEGPQAQWQEHQALAQCPAAWQRLCIRVSA